MKNENFEKAEARTKELRGLLKKYSDAYYKNDAPLVSDAEYDDLFRELERLEKKFPALLISDSPTQIVGSAAVEAFKKFEHKVPMLSLANAMNLEELSAFDQRIKKILNSADEIEYYCELKFDGLSMNLIYENGILTHAATRGDGRIGEEVTLNAKTIKNIPHKISGKNIPQFIEIRGEVLLPIKAFQALNREREEEGAALFANPRNAAAGSMRQLDSKLTAERDLRFYAYSVGDSGSNFFYEKQSELVEILLSWGFESVEFRKRCIGVAAVNKFYDEIAAKRDQLPFDIDGVVVKVNSFRMQQELGFVSRSPRSMIAYKFPPRQEITQLEDIIVQVGRTGVLSPVAVLKPVNVHGVVVSRATLHNQEEIERKQILIGDWVLVQRAGDVIPEVVRVLLEKRTGGEKKFIFPEACPVCLSAVVRAEGEVAIRCVNEDCPAQLQQSIEHFVSKGGVEIVGLGPKIIEQLIEKKIIHRYSDLYKIQKNDLLQLEGFQEKSANKLLKAIADSKKCSLHAFIYALGIRHVGEQLAKALARKFQKMEPLFQVTLEELLNVDDVGETVAQSILDYFSKTEKVAEIKKIISLGIQFEELDNHSNKFENAVFVLTGTLPSLSRQAATELIEKNGGKVSGSVSKKTSFVLSGEDAGSKLERARELGVAVISEDEFLQMIK